MIFTELNRMQCKSYLIGCEQDKKAIIIDPVQEKVDRYLAMLAYHDLKLEYVADTHTHADHRSACVMLKSLIGCKIMRHQLSPQPNVDVHVDNGDTIAVGEVEIKVLHTPGHTPDSVSFYVDNRVLTGDVLLIGGTGRSDFTDGDAGMQFDSITGILFSLADETLVYPGHDYRGNTQSSIGNEKQNNPRINNRTREEYIDIMNNLDLELPDNIQEVLLTNITEEEDNEITLPSMTALNQVRRINVESLMHLINIQSSPPIVDVRNQDEYTGELGHISGSILIPLRQLAKRSHELDEYRTQQIILVCRAGVRSITAAAILTGIGFTQVCDLEGGMVGWNKKNYPVDRASGVI